MTLFDLVQQHTHVTRVSARQGGEWRGACPLCGGGPKSDRFIVWPAQERYWCRQCHQQGDAIQFLRDVRGLSFREAAALVGKELSETDTARQARERAVKERLLDDYWRWFHRTYAATCAAFRALAVELDVAAIGYTATVRCPTLYPDAEKDYWEQRLGHLYDTLASVEYDCDVLTYDQHLAKRLAWWTEAQASPSPPEGKKERLHEP